jgi:hypothetical protein
MSVDPTKVLAFLDEIQFLDKFNRHKALSMMSTGAVLGIVGFGIAAIGGYWNIYAENNMKSKISGPYPSGEPYFPLTVSEMVSDPRSSAGKTFLAFELCAAIMILGSWYPYMLSNVYIGSRYKPLRCCVWCPSWATIRQFIPMVGLFLVALVSVTPQTRMVPSDFVTNQIHILAATALFGGYILVELVCLFLQADHVPQMSERGGCVRTVCILGCAVGAVTTIVLQFTYPYAPLSILPCQDEYKTVSIDDLQSFIGNNTDMLYDASTYMQSVAFARGLSKTDPITVLVNTAHGTCLSIKMITFWSEVVAGVLGLGSHLVIWYFAPERHMKIKDDNTFLDDLGSDSDFDSGFEDS